MRDAILVLGMHRSGTSAVAGVMAHLGAALPRRLIPGNGNNERGYFESIPLNVFHEKLLKSAASCWRDWRRFDSQWLASPPAAFKADAKRLLEEEFGEAPLFVLKDPRACRFIPFWLSVLNEGGIAPRAVIPLRSPFEVAASLRARDQFSIEDGLLLWLRHVLDAERETRALPRSFVAMDKFLTDWRKCARQIARDIGIAWPHLDDESSARIDNFLSRDLKHHNLESVKQDAASAWVARSYEAVSILARDPRSKLARAALDEVSCSFEQADVLMGPAFMELEAQVASLQADVAALAAARDALAKARDEAPAVVSPAGSDVGSSQTRACSASA